MADLKINEKNIGGVDLVIFDRDGTLIELYDYWSWMIGQRAELICQKIDFDREYLPGLIFAMGIDSENKKIRPQGPVGLKKREKVMQCAAEYLSRQGIPDTHEDCVEAFKNADRLSTTNLAS
ncbi:hypothetical protein ACFLZ3_05840, partial [Candidatus Omnitrophota bacterium]